jgi:hypothetical protein
MSERGEYGKQGGGGLTASTALALGLAVVGIVVAPVVAIVGGAALAAAVGGRGGKQ